MSVIWRRNALACSVFPPDIAHHVADKRIEQIAPSPQPSPARGEGVLRFALRHLRPRSLRGEKESLRFAVLHFLRPSPKPTAAVPMTGDCIHAEPL